MTRIGVQTWVTIGLMSSLFGAKLSRKPMLSHKKDTRVECYSFEIEYWKVDIEIFKFKALSPTRLPGRDELIYVFRTSSHMCIPIHCSLIYNIITWYMTMVS